MSTKTTTEDEVTVPEALETYYQKASGDVRIAVEKVRTAIILGRREQRWREAEAFQQIEKELRRDGLFLKEWCEAAGEDYEAASHAIRDLKRRGSQHTRRAGRGDRPENTGSGEPNGEPNREGEGDDNNEDDKDKDDDEEDKVHHGQGPKTLPFYVTAADKEHINKVLKEVRKAWKMKHPKMTQSQALLHILDDWYSTWLAEGKPVAA